MLRHAIFLYLVCLAIAEDYNNFTKLLEMVNDNITAANNYVIPKDNSALLTLTNDEIVDLNAYDFIIIGSGSAGAVLANRLTEVSEWRVLLLEAGGSDNNFTDILALSTAYTGFSELNWGYNSTTQKNACLAMEDQQCSYPRGRARGGSSTINYGVYARGTARDYDRWEELGNEGWGWDYVFPYLLKSEKADFKDRDFEYHGTDGYLHVDVTSKTEGVEETITDAFAELGVERGDYNGKNITRLDRCQFTLNRNIRSSTAHAYLDGFEDERSNLVLSLRSFVTKVLIHEYNKTAYGVEFIKNGRKYRVNATKEVIVSGGTINTPQILILSGVGPASHLEELGIDVIQDLPVGKYMEDHPGYVGFYFRTNHTFWNNTLSDLLVRWTKNLRPLTAGLCVEMVSFGNVNGGSLGRPDMEFTMQNSFYPSSGLSKSFNFNKEFTSAYNNSLHDWWFIPTLQHPKSRGTVRLQSKDPKDVPLIDPNFLSDKEGYDLETLYLATQYLLKLNETEAFKNYGASFYNVPVPPCDAEYKLLSKDWWTCAIKYLSLSFYHPCGTARMGNSSSDSVVNNKLKVHGVKNLRVIDASIMPETITGHLNAAVIMIAEKAADIIKAEYNVL